MRYEFENIPLTDTARNELVRLELQQTEAADALAAAPDDEKLLKNLLAAQTAVRGKREELRIRSDALELFQQAQEKRSRAERYNKGREAHARAALITAARIQSCKDIDKAVQDLQVAIAVYRRTSQMALDEHNKFLASLPYEPVSLDHDLHTSRGREWLQAEGKAIVPALAQGLDIALRGLAIHGHIEFQYTADPHKRVTVAEAGLTALTQFIASSSPVLAKLERELNGETLQ